MAGRGKSGSKNQTEQLKCGGCDRECQAGGHTGRVCRSKSQITFCMILVRVESCEERRISAESTMCSTSVTVHVEGRSGYIYEGEVESEEAQASVGVVRSVEVGKLKGH